MLTHPYARGEHRSVKGKYAGPTPFRWRRPFESGSVVRFFRSPPEARMKRRSTHALIALILLTCTQHAHAQRAPAAQPKGADSADSRGEPERGAELEKHALSLLSEAR